MCQVLYAIARVQHSRSHARPHRSKVLRYLYSSLITPPTVFDYDLESGDRAVKKVQPVLGGYDPGKYVTRRLWATAGDGVKVCVYALEAQVWFVAVRLFGRVRLDLVALALIVSVYVW